MGTILPFKPFKCVVCLLLMGVITVHSRPRPEAAFGGYSYPVPKIPFNYPIEEDNSIYGPPRRTETTRQRTQERTRPIPPTERSRSTSRVRLEEEPLRPPQREPEVPKEDVQRDRQKSITRERVETEERRSTGTITRPDGETVTIIKETRNRGEPGSVTNTRTEELTREEVLNRGVVNNEVLKTRTSGGSSGGSGVVMREEVTIVTKGTTRPEIERSRGTVTTRTQTTTNRASGREGSFREENISDILNSGGGRTSTTVEEQLYIRTSDGRTREISESELDDLLASIRNRGRVSTTTTFNSGSSSGTSSGGSSGGSSRTISETSSTEVKDNLAPRSYQNAEESRRSTNKQKSGSSFSYGQDRQDLRDRQDRPRRDRQDDYDTNEGSGSQRSFSRFPRESSTDQHSFLLLASADQVARFTGAQLYNNFDF